MRLGQPTLPDTYYSVYLYIVVYIPTCSLLLLHFSLIPSCILRRYMLSSTIRGMNPQKGGFVPLHFKPPPLHIYTSSTLFLSKQEEGARVNTCRHHPIPFISAALVYIAAGLGPFFWYIACTRLPKNGGLVSH